jgi:hypothetical protein
MSYTTEWNLNFILIAKKLFQVKKG